MKKILIVTSFATSVLFAADFAPFVGVDLLSSKGQYDTKSSVTSRTMQSNDTGYHLKAGVIKDNQCRIYLSHSQTSDSIDNNKYKYSLTALNYDYMFLEGTWRPYLGVHGGYSRSQFGRYNNETMPDVSSWDLGTNIGLIANISESISFEAGYKWTYVKATSDLTTSGTPTYQEKLRYQQSFSLGFNYSF